MFFETIIVPLASYNTQLASRQSDRILAHFCRFLISTCSKGKVNQNGCINLYLDYLALAEFVGRQQKTAQKLIINTIGGEQQSLKIDENSIEVLKVVSEYVVNCPDGLVGYMMGGRKSKGEIQEATDLIWSVIEKIKDEKCVVNEKDYPSHVY